MVPYYVIVKYISSLLLFLTILNDYVIAQYKLDVLHQWKFVDFTYPSAQARDLAVQAKKYIAENCVILDVDVWQRPVIYDSRILVNSGHISNNYNNNAIKSSLKKRVFVTIPRFKSGVPVTLATVSNQKRGDNTLLAPFPNWGAQREGNCDGITSVYRVKVDKCGTLWVVDSGKVENFSPNPRTLCQPQILAFDLNNGDKLIKRYQIPDHVLDQNSLLVTVAVDTRDDFCRDTFLYIADVTAFKLIVFDVRQNRIWRIGSNYFYPFPLDGKFNVAGVTFNLMDGLLALTLGPLQNGDRQLYFHSLASIREGSISTSIIRNESLFADDIDSSWDQFSISEPARSSQSAGEDMSDNGIMIFGLLSEMALACWDSRTSYTANNIHIVHQDNETLQFPSGIKIIGDTIWILTSELQNFIAGTYKPNDVKYRILVGSVSNLVHGTGCQTRCSNCLVHEQATDFEKIASSETRPIFESPVIYGTSETIPSNQAFPFDFKSGRQTENWRKFFKFSDEPRYEIPFFNFG